MNSTAVGGGGGGGGGGVSSNNASYSASAAASASSRYTAQLKSCEMRYVILKNELDETTAEEALVAKKRSKIKTGEQEKACFCILL